jgi:hypothetical protein
LKSQKNHFGNKVLDGAFKTKCERLAADNNPSLFLLNYDLKKFGVLNFFVVPKHFFIRDIIEERKPLALTARRAGWIGSHILLNKIPESGKSSLSGMDRKSRRKQCWQNGIKRFSCGIRSRKRVVGSWRS